VSFILPAEDTGYLLLKAVREGAIANPATADAELKRKVLRVDFIGFNYTRGDS
jgi:hypothetical protein